MFLTRIFRNTILAEFGIPRNFSPSAVKSRFCSASGSTVDALKLSQVDLSEQSSWDHYYRYKKSELFTGPLHSEKQEWFLSSQEAVDFVLPEIMKCSRMKTLLENNERKEREISLLEFGCGTSDFGVALCKSIKIELSHQRLSSDQRESLNVKYMGIDFSQTAIAAQNKRHSFNPDFGANFKFYCGTLEEFVGEQKSETTEPAKKLQQYDIFIDKGSTDAVLMGKKRREAEAVLLTLVGLVATLLEHGGLWLMISDCPPELRLVELTSAIGSWNRRCLVKTTDASNNPVNFELHSIFEEHTRTKIHPLEKYFLYILKRKI